MIGLDTNILLYSLHPGSADHAAAKRFLEGLFRDKTQGVAIADYVLVELYVLLRNPAVMAKPPWVWTFRGRDCPELSLEEA